MKLALYQPWIYQRGGMERVILEMTSPRSRHDWTIFTSHYSPQTTFSEFRDRRVVELKRVSVKRTPLQLLAVTATIAGQKLPLEGFDGLVVSTAGFGEFITLRNHSLPTVCFCHTPLRVIHDAAAHNDLLKEKLHTLPAFLAFETAYRAVEKQSWKHFAAIACNSNETKKRVLAGGLAQGEKLCVIHPGVHVNEFKPSWHYGNYFLVPGRISKLKNLGLALESFKKFVAEGGRKAESFKLVIAGGVGEKDKAYLEKLLADAGGDKKIIFETDVSESRLYALYRGCYAVLFTALNEDWGIVPLEAMAFGKPVIAVNEGGPRESIEHRKTGLLVEATPAHFAAAMRQLVANFAFARKLGRAGRRGVREFDWDNFVKQMDGLVERNCPRQH